MGDPPGDRAVDLQVSRLQRPDRLEGQRVGAKAVNDDTAPHGVDTVGEPLRRFTAREHVAFLDLKEQGSGGHAAGIDDLPEKPHKWRMLERLSRYIDGECAACLAVQVALDHMAQ